MKYIDYLNSLKDKKARFHPRGKGGILDINGKVKSDDYESFEVELFEVMDDFVVLKDTKESKTHRIYFSNITVIESE